MSIKNCPRCGKSMRSVTNGNICTSCGNEIYLSDFTHTNKTILEPKKTDSISGLYGWICPKCGAVMSPFERSCVKCTQHNFEITYNTRHSISNGSTVNDFIDFRQDKLGYR